MADNKPTKWSLSKNSPIGNYGTIVDSRLTTINQSNPRGYIKLSTTSNDRLVDKLYYAIQTNGEVTYALLNDNGEITAQFNNIQEIADSQTASFYGYTSATTLKIKDSLQTNLQQRTQNIILSSAPPVTSPTSDQQGGNPPASQNQPGGNSPASGSGGDTSTPITEIEAKPVNVTFKSIRASRLQYPLDMKNDQDKIKFQACEFQKREEPTGKELTFKFSKPQYEPISSKLKVVLGIQAPISDQNSVDWNSGAAGAIESALYYQSLEAMKPNSSPGETLENMLKGGTTTAKQYLNQLQRAAAGQAAGLSNVLARTDNAILNPNLELLFNGPQLRPFSFQFKMSARNEDEAIEIKNIIKYFKYYMAVRETKDGLFLKSPHVFTIQYMKGEKIRHRGINLISPSASKKACALVNCSVDYTPLGSYMTYNDTKKPDAEGTMVAYTLSLQFQEIEPIYNTDYEIDHPIGY